MQVLIAAPIFYAIAGIILGAIFAVIPYKKLSYRKKIIRAGIISLIIWFIIFTFIVAMIGVRFGLSF